MIFRGPPKRDGVPPTGGPSRTPLDSVEPVTPVPRSFYAAAFLAGVAYANVAVALPLYAIMLGRPASFAGGLLAAHTLAIAFGAVGSTPVLGRLGGRNTLAAGLAVSAIGQAVLLVPLGTTALVWARCSTVPEWDFSGWGRRRCWDDAREPRAPSADS
jgi:MFS family permease